ncbi:hypothetical protein V1527DRAFT_477223 [Lipomyces starkeyi]
MLLMSWGGEQADLVKDKVELWDDYRRSINEIHELRVQHGDLHSDKILGNSQLGRVQIIDFHRSKLLEPQVRRLKSGLPTCNETDWCQCARRLRPIIRVSIGVRGVR